jgi:hypothetical protein
MLHQRKPLQIMFVIRDMGGVVAKTPFELSNDTPLSLTGLHQSLVKVIACSFEGCLLEVEIRLATENVTVAGTFEPVCLIKQFL